MTDRRCTKLLPGGNVDDAVGRSTQEFLVTAAPLADFLQPPLSDELLNFVSELDASLRVVAVVVMVEAVLISIALVWGRS